MCKQSKELIIAITSNGKCVLYRFLAVVALPFSVHKYWFSDIPQNIPRTSTNTFELLVSGNPIAILKLVIQLALHKYYLQSCTRSTKQQDLRNEKQIITVHTQYMVTLPGKPVKTDSQEERQ